MLPSYKKKQNQIDRTLFTWNSGQFRLSCNSHTLYFRAHFRAENAECDFIFDLLFPGQRGMFQRCGLPDMPHLLTVFCHCGEKHSKQKLTKNADITGVFGICTPLILALHPLAPPWDRKIKLYRGLCPYAQSFMRKHGGFSLFHSSLFTKSAHSVF